MTSRKPDHPVNELFVNRWSPRAFDGSDMPETDLKTILEAARWAPSAFNIQPWRFVYARRDDDNWGKLLELLNPFNLGWAQHASALVFLFSDTEIDGKDGDPNRPSGTHSLDAGAAWAQAAPASRECVPLGRLGSPSLPSISVSEKRKTSAEACCAQPRLNGFSSSSSLPQLSSSRRA